MVQATLTARFTKPDSQVNLKLAYGGPLRDFNSFAFQLFPAVNARVVATSGTVEEQRGHRELRDVTDFVTFSNSDSVETQYPVENLVSVEALFPAVDENGRQVSVQIYADAATKTLRADKPCSGAFKVVYDTSYKQYYYVFQGPERSIANLTQLAAFFDGVIQYLGKILAFYEGATAELTVEQLQFDQNGNNSFVELYKVVSEYIADSEGGWEVPPEWPEDSTYPGLGAEGPDEGSHQQLERVHEIGYRDDRGRMYQRSFNIRAEQPYDTDASYRPRVRLDANGAVPAEVMAGIVERFPGITT